MKKNYEQPIAELVKFEVTEKTMSSEEPSLPGLTTSDEVDDF